MISWRSFQYSVFIYCVAWSAPLAKMASCEFSKYVGGDCGASLVLPSGDLCVRISECSKDIKGHLKTCGVSDGTLCSEATLLLARAGKSNSIRVSPVVAWMKVILFNLPVYPYLFTYKAHSVIRRTLNFRRRLWQVSKIKISPKYPVIRHTQNYGKILLTMFAVLTTICFQKLLITVLSLSKQKRKSHTLQTIAKKVTHRQ